MELIKLLIGDTLPKKELFNLNEIAKLLDTEREELGVWEMQFPQLFSRRLRNGVRIYDRHALMLFSVIKRLLIEKAMPLALAQKAIAETDTASWHSTRNESDLLHDAYQLLPKEEVGFDEITHDIYYELKHSLNDSPQNTIIDCPSRDEQARIRREAYQERLAFLLTERESLHEILGSLDKYAQPSIPLDITD